MTAGGRAPGVDQIRFLPCVRPSGRISPRRGLGVRPQHLRVLARTLVTKKALTLVRLMDDIGSMIRRECPPVLPKPPAPASLDPGAAAASSNLARPSVTPAPPVKSLREFIRDTLLERIARAATPRLKGRGDFAVFQQGNPQLHRTVVEAPGNSILLKTGDSLFFQFSRRFTMDCLAGADPVAIARERPPIVDALENGDSDLGASLLASYSNPLV